MAAAQGDLVEARSREFLFNIDMDVIRIRELLKEAFLAQLDRRRVPVADRALVHPI